MKHTLLLVLTIAGCHMAFAQADVPANIKAGFAKQYPHATKVKWQKEGEHFESSFMQGKKEMSVVYSQNGVVEETETRIAVSALPAKAQQYATAKGSIKEAAKIVLANGTVRYEAEVKGKDLIFDDKGNFLEAKADEDKD